jgi:heme-degrading monooxygenase HmoA
MGSRVICVHLGKSAAMDLRLRSRGRKLQNDLQVFPAARSDGTSFTPQNERSTSMFTRIVEITTKTGKARELTRTINDKVLALLRTQSGFVDEVILISDQNPDRVLAMSFWNTKEDAEKYNRETFPKVNEIIRGTIEGAPKVQTFDVEQSTVHKIAAGKAA